MIYCHSIMQKPRQYKWHGTTGQLEQFVTRKLKIPLDTDLLQKFNNGSCLVLKTPSVTFNFYIKTKTLQVQGKATEEIKIHLPKS